MMYNSGLSTFGANTFSTLEAASSSSASISSTLITTLLNPSPVLALNKLSDKVGSVISAERDLVSPPASISVVISNEFLSAAGVKMKPCCGRRSTASVVASVFINVPAE